MKTEQKFYRENELWESATASLRILSIEENRLLVIDCIKRTMPYWISRTAFETLIEADCFTSTFGENDTLTALDAKERKTAVERFSLLGGILPHIGNESMRSKAINETAALHDITPKTLRKYLCTYLATNDIGSLAPTKKAVRSLTSDEKNIRRALNKYYYTHAKHTLKTAYTMMLKDSYTNEFGTLLSPYPSYYQFRYYYRKHHKESFELIRRNGLKAYQRNNRPLLGDNVQNFASACGVGMLDSTICDIYLVNEYGAVIGRPILTACIDAFSGLCMGYSLSLEGGMYSLRDLMLNVVSDKVEHCKRHGILIEKDKWPCSSLPQRLVTDKGSEYVSQNFEQLIDLGISLTNLPPYRPDLKGPVEKFFDCIQNYYKPFLKGHGVIEDDFLERGAIDYRKTATLTLDDFEKVILYSIIFYNSRRTLDNFPYTNEMLDLAIPPYANKIWLYGKNLVGASLIEAKPKDVMLTLLPRTQGTFCRNGLKVNGMRYHNDTFNERYLSGNVVTVAYNSDDVSTVWLFENGQYIPFKLIEARFASATLDEVGMMKQKQKQLVKAEAKNRNQAEVELAEHILNIANGTKRKDTDTKNIRTTRNREKEYRHKDFLKEVANDE